MGWIFSAFLIVSLLHMGEEYFFPGGFSDLMKRMNPRFAPYVTGRMAVAMNGLQLALCVLAMLVGEKALIFSLSVAGLIYINAWVHVLAAFRVRGYAPGVVTGVLLYLPLASFAYGVFLSSGALSLGQALVTVLLGIAYQALPMAYLTAASARKQRRVA